MLLPYPTFLIADSASKWYAFPLLCDGGRSSHCAEGGPGVVMGGNYERFTEALPRLRVDCRI